MEQFQTVSNKEDTQALIEDISQGKFTLLDFKKQIQTIIKMGPISNIAQMIPGMDNMMSQINGEDAAKSIKRMIYILNSMHQKELESNGRIFIKEPSRMIRVVKGSDTSVVDVESVLMQQQMMTRMAKRAKQSQAAAAAAAASANGGGMPRIPGMPNINPHMIQQAQQILRQNLRIMKNMINMFGGNSGVMPDMNEMMKMMQDPQMQQMARHFGMGM